jgi:hypothetical protein
MARKKKGWKKCGVVFAVLLAFAGAAPVATTGCFTATGLHPERIHQAPTPLGKLTAFKLEHAKILVYANSYRTSMAPDPVIVERLQALDLDVTRYETAAGDAINAGMTDTMAINLNLAYAALSLIRADLIRLGYLELVED